MSKIRLLKSFAKGKLNPDFYTGDAPDPDLEEFIRGFPGREPVADDAVLVEVVEACMKNNPDIPPRKRSSTDSWLAPRVHAALRLTRREAGDRNLWNYLAVKPLRKYVNWRWTTDPEKGPEPVRYFGEIRKNAIARLWWGAELTRNGESYADTELFFSNQDVVNSWLQLLALRHRPAALAAVRFVYNNKIKGFNIGEIQRGLSKSVNSALTTHVIDSLAVNEPAEENKATGWLKSVKDLQGEHIATADNIRGPSDAPVSPESIGLISDLFARIAEKTLFEKRGNKPKVAVAETAKAT